MKRRLFACVLPTAAMALLTGCSATPITDLNAMSERISILQFGVVMALIVLVAQTFVGYRWITRLENEIERRDSPPTRPRRVRLEMEDYGDDLDDDQVPIAYSAHRPRPEYVDDVLEVDDERPAFTQKRPAPRPTPGAQSNRHHVVIDDDDEGPRYE